VLLTLIQPSIQIWNLQVDEPITTLTDLVLATVSFYAFYRIRKQGEKGRFREFFGYYFLSLGLGALTGGLLGHAFLYRIAPGWKLISWVLAIISVSLMIHAMVEVTRPLIRVRLTRMILLVNWMLMPLALFLTMSRLSFSPVTLYTIYGMLLVVGSLSFYTYRKTGSRGVFRFLLAVGLGLISALIFSKQWGFSPWFNHNDISHLILAACAILFYKGGILFMKVQGSGIASRNISF
jgi:MFS family permease